MVPQRETVSNRIVNSNTVHINLLLTIIQTYETSLYRMTQEILESAVILILYFRTPMETGTENKQQNRMQYQNTSRIVLLYNKSDNLVTICHFKDRKH